MTSHPNSPRGAHEAKVAAARLPYEVRVEVPPMGLGHRLTAMHDWAMDRFGKDGYRTTAAAADHDGGALVFGFMTAEDAAAFRGVFFGV